MSAMAQYATRTLFCRCESRPMTYSPVPSNSADAVPTEPDAAAGKAAAERNCAVDLRGIELKLASEAGMVNILRGIDLSIAQGESLSIVGPSGSGKTSLMMIMAGLESPTAGEIEVAGVNLRSASEDTLSTLRRDKIGIVFQSFHLIPTMTALENVAVPLELAGRADAFEAAARALTAVGLEHRLSHYPSQLSGGEQQRTALARAVSTEPRLLLADEPTGNLDGETGQTIVELLFRLHDEAGATLVLITHDERLAARCDRVVRLKDGQIAGEGPGQG